MNLRLALAAALTALAMLSARAEEPKPGAGATLEALFPKGETVCFARRYDGAHMKRHPKQTVTSIRLMRGFQQVRDDDKREDFVYAELIATYRDQGERRFLNGATCRTTDDGKIFCSADGCDAGSFQLTIDGPDAITIGEPGARSYFMISGGCGGGDEDLDRSLSNGEDDNVFKLTRAPMADCR